MKEILFTIGGFNIYGYGLMYALSLVVGLFLAEYRAKIMGLDKEFTFNMGFISIIFGVIGAKLLHLITVFDELLEDFWGTLSNSLTEGFVVYGGIIAAVVTGYIMCRIKKKNFLNYFDIAVPSVAIGQAIGRIGCLLSGCCYGKETDAWYGITFPAGSHAPSGVSLYPVQPISSALNIINFIILLIAAKRFKTPGRVSALYMINYGVGRFLVEFLRDDPRGSVLGLSTSQFISVIVLLLGIILMVFSPKINDIRDKKQSDKEDLNRANED